MTPGMTDHDNNCMCEVHVSETCTECRNLAFLRSTCRDAAQTVFQQLRDVPTTPLRIHSALFLLEELILAGAREYAAAAIALADENRGDHRASESWSQQLPEQRTEVSIAVALRFVFAELTRRNHVGLFFFSEMARPIEHLRQMLSRESH